MSKIFIYIILFYKRILNNCGEDVSYLFFLVLKKNSCSWYSFLDRPYCKLLFNHIKDSKKRNISLNYIFVKKIFSFLFYNVIKF